VENYSYLDRNWIALLDTLKMDHLEPIYGR